MNTKFRQFISEKTSEKSFEFVKAKLIKRFHEDKTVTVKEIEKIAKENSLTVEDINKLVYDILSNFLYRTRNRREIEVDKKELELGIEEEKEHTDDPEIAKIIALDHLYAVKNYYTLLKYVEDTNEK